MEMKIVMVNGEKFRLNESLTKNLLNRLKKEPDIRKIEPIEVTNAQGLLTDIIFPPHISNISLCRKNIL